MEARTSSPVRSTRPLKCLVFPEWRSRFVVEKVQRSTVLLAVSGSKLFACAPCAATLRREGETRKLIGESSSVRTSPPAAKLGAGVEKSPGPSLFYASAVASMRRAAHSCKPSRQGLNGPTREDARQPLSGRLAAPPTSADEAGSTSAVT